MTLTVRMPAALAESPRAAARIHGRSTSEELRLAAWLDVTRRELRAEAPELARGQGGESPIDPRSGAVAVPTGAASGD